MQGDKGGVCFKGKGGHTADVSFVELVCCCGVSDDLSLSFCCLLSQAEYHWDSSVILMKLMLCSCYSGKIVR
jgi:hypothetical protein